jgi:hypothetical protein
LKSLSARELECGQCAGGAARDRRPGDAQMVEPCSEGIGLALGRRIVGDVAAQIAEAGFGVPGRPMARRLG